PRFAFERISFAAFPFQSTKLQGSTSVRLKSNGCYAFVVFHSAGKYSFIVPFLNNTSSKCPIFCLSVVIKCICKYVSWCVKIVLCSNEKKPTMSTCSLCSSYFLCPLCASSGELTFEPFGKFTT